MGTILESVNNLSEKLGVEEREQTIKDQLDLCVERLGGEGYSKDIAESADKFADKEDGTATFTTKSITENGTYAASDDGVSGYSSVTVDVAGGASFAFTYIPFCTLTNGTYNTEYACDLPDANGEHNVTFSYSEQTDPTHIGSGSHILATPAVKVNVTTDIAGGQICFTPDINFDGFYKNGSKKTLTGDTITPGDGKLYRMDYDGYSNTWAITKFDSITIINN